MPLRAFVNDKEITLPTAQSEWENLKYVPAISLPCCGSTAYARLSKLGLQHFVHRHVSSTCDWKPETAQHLYAKSEIVVGCRNAGYHPKSEVSGPGWRADVLAVKGSIKIAFEVQTSPQGLRETILRHTRYERDHIRGCWFFKKPPERIDQPYVVDEDDLAWQEHNSPTRELPVFRIAEDANVPIVRLNSRKFQLRDFVRMLLNKEVQFRSRSAFCQRRLSVEVRRAVCPLCGGAYGFLSVAQTSYLSKCGVEWPQEREFKSGMILPEDAEPILRFLNSEYGSQFGIFLQPVVNIDKRYQEWSFHCSNCKRRVFPHLDKKALKTPSIVKHELMGVLRFPVSRPVFHWCHSEGGALCPCE